MFLKTYLGEILKIIAVIKSDQWKIRSFVIHGIPKSVIFPQIAFDYSFSKVHVQCVVGLPKFVFSVSFYSFHRDVFLFILTSFSKALKLIYSFSLKLTDYSFYVFKTQMYITGMKHEYKTYYTVTYVC